MLSTKNYLDFQIIEPNTGEVIAEWKGAEKANHAIPEDIVELDSSGQIKIIQAAAKKPLVGILHLTSKYMYGMTGHGVPLYLCEPMNQGYPCFRVACKERDRSRNLLVSFQFESWESGSELPRGALLKILGPVEDSTAEGEALAILSCPWSAPRPESHMASPSDRFLLSTGTFNIDPPGCLDIDDVITIKNIDESKYQIWITIADVSEVVKRGSKIYEVAEKIGATSYQDGKAVRPMLHRDLSEKACSLLPGEIRFGLSLRINFDRKSGERSSPSFQKVLVKNEKSFTYESVLASDHQDIQNVLTAFSGSEDPHKWIEYCMLLYNREAAKIIHEAGKGLLRAHDAPFQERLHALEAINPSLRFLAYQAAKYVGVGQGGAHWGLGVDLYCHASSPIRRFADLVNQQIIKDVITGRLSNNEERNDKRLAAHLNRRQKQIIQAERDFIILKAIQLAENAEVSGTFLWRKKEKAEFFINSWNCTIGVICENDLIQGKSYRIQYYCDRRKAAWKQRMIYRVLEDSSEQ